MATGGVPRLQTSLFHNPGNPRLYLEGINLNSRPLPVNLTLIPEEDPTCTLAYMDETYRPVTSDGFIKKKIVRYGNGAAIVAGSFMTIHYEVFAFDSDGKRSVQPFDSSRTRPDLEDDRYTDRTVAEPKEYRLMEGEVIGVLDVGVATMEVGETANFVARGPYAYGNFGLPGIVGRNAPVFLQVEVLKSLEATPLQKILQGILTDKSEASLEDIYKAGIVFKKKGNSDYQQRCWNEALRNYRRSLAWIEGNTLIFPADVQRFTSLQFVLFNNMAACYLKIKRFHSVIKYCNMALDVPDKPDDLQGANLGKLYYRLGAAQFELKQYDKAMDSITKANGITPYNPDVVSIFAKLREIREQQKQQGDAMWKRIATRLLK